MSKERKIQKDKVQSVKEWKNTKKKYKNTKCVSGSNGKIQKKTKCMFFVFIVYLFFVKIQNNYKKYKINTNAISQKYKIQKNTNQKFQKYKIQTKKYEPKISKIQIQKWAREPTPCSFWKARTNLWNKCKANLLYFLNPAIQILYFWVVFCSFFFWSF